MICTMKALVIHAPRSASIDDVPDPLAGEGQVVVDVRRVGVCGTDLELFSGDMAYLASGRTTYPVRPGHEWTGEVSAVGSGVDEAWLGARVAGDTMLVCGRCDHCLRGSGQVCRNLVEVGISLGFDGALAEKVAVPVASVHRLPDSIDDTMGALVEPGANAFRAAAAANAEPGSRVLVWGAGAIGLLAAAFLRADGIDVHVIARRPARLDLARQLGIPASTPDSLPDEPFHAVIDATNDPLVPAAAIDRVEADGRVVLIGLSGRASTVDTRGIALKDLDVVGVLGGWPALDDVIARYADGRVDPRSLVAATVPLARGPDVLAGWHPGTPPPKIHIDPTA